MDFNLLGRTAIPGDNPGGIDARYEPEFEAVLAEIEKLSSPTASGQVNWDRIVENGAAVLNTKSKDLSIACYMAVGLVCTRRIDGLDLGLQVLADLVENFWESLYPPKKRMRGRVSAIEWWMGRIQSELQKLTPPPVAAEQAARLVDTLKRLDATLSANMPDAPVLRALQRQIESIPVQGDQAPDASPATPAAPAALTPAPAAAGAPEQAAAMPAAVDKGGLEQSLSGQIHNADDARRAGDAALQRLRETSLFLLQQNLKDPLAYRFRRIAGWAKLTSLPPNVDGNTQLIQPPPQVISAIETLRVEGNWQSLIQQAEPKMSQYLFWFDLQRHVAVALDSLGEGFGKASDVVCQETAMLLERLPGLETLRFVNGMPFADGESLQWMKSIRSGGGSAPIPLQVVAEGGATDVFDTVLQKARALAQKKNLPEAVNLLQQEMQGCGACGRKMRWRLAIARLLLEVKKPNLAMPHLEQIVSDIDAYRLETWDPPLAVEGLSMACQTLASQNEKVQKDRAMMLLQRIAAIDPGTALRLGQ
jgi:type VI secretion system protein VasJ